ncbi:hypothetical protein [Paraburkholderia fungorum]|uniref:Mercuric ion transport protein n=1 Tax=Paraburkholderia fungorum TaxID=134537 RepID=A0AAW3V0W0_9BURK|nr:hypothetical protein [Paraburkholderia fungorum]MBB4518571.1 hypothetical protein [Paraburkholderia fungorum]MBB6204056.1 hypothetical protein [Paraburkholderia fungorum]
MKTEPSPLRQSAVSWLTLFTSAGTLICCALPILFVMLGLGAAVAAVTSAAPFLVTLALHKRSVFADSGLMLLISGWLMYRAGRACPSDPEGACASARIAGTAGIMASRRPSGASACSRPTMSSAFGGVGNDFVENWV